MLGVLFIPYGIDNVLRDDFIDPYYLTRIIPA